MVPFGKQQEFISETSVWGGGVGFKCEAARTADLSISTQAVDPEWIGGLDDFGIEPA
jgi:hypothetical protein